MPRERGSQFPITLLARTTTSLMSRVDDSWSKQNPSFAAPCWQFRELQSDVATSAILHLYAQLDDWDCISGWCGPLYQYGGGFENYFGTSPCDAQSIFLRDGALVMALFAAWCAAEEMYVLSESSGVQLQNLVDSIVPYDTQHSRLQSVTLEVLRLLNNYGNYSNWNTMDVWRLQRESRWGLEHIVRPVLSGLDSI